MANWDQFYKFNGIDPLTVANISASYVLLIVKYQS